MTKNALIVGLALVCLGVSESVVQAQKPGDGCALLQAADIQALAGTAKVGAGKATTDALGSRMCQYAWRTGGNVRSGRSFLNLSVTPTSKAFPGMDASFVRQGLLANAKAGAPNTAVIPAVGDAAIYESDDPIRVKTTALARGNVLIVSFESSDARGKKDQVIALLKAALVPGLSEWNWAAYSNSVDRVRHRSTGDLDPSKRTILTGGVGSTPAL